MCGEKDKLKETKEMIFEYAEKEQNFRHNYVNKQQGVEVELNKTGLRYYYQLYFLLYNGLSKKWMRRDEN